MKYIYFFGFIIWSSLSIGQNQTPCSSEQYNQFDFWLGEWEVYNPNGQLVGENSIVKKDGACWIMEDWTGGKGTTGTSMNYYDPKDDSWNQIWLDNGGTRLILKGQWDGENMTMEDEGGVQGDENVRNSISWTPNDDGSVTQTWKLVNSYNGSEKVLFQGLYRKKKE